MKRALAFVLTLLLLLCLALPAFAAAPEEEAAAFTVENQVWQQTLAAQAGEMLGFDAAKSYLTDRLLQGESRIELASYQIPVSVFVDGNGSIGSAYQSYLFANSVLFHVNKYYAPGLEQKDGLVIALLPLYTLDEPELSATLELYRAELERALSRVTPDMSRLDKALVIHDYLALNYSYRSSSSPVVPEAQMQSIILNKYGNCYAYTRAYEYLLNKAGVPCGRAVSYDLVHIWNQVQLDDGCWYHVDVTWDDPLPDLIGYVDHRYFLLSDREIMNREHSCSDMERAYAADSTTYDAAPWGTARSQILIHDGLWYYVDSAYKKAGQRYPSGAVMQYDPSQPTQAPLVYHEMGTPWPDFGHQLYWSRIYSGCGIYDDRLYYQSIDTVYSIALPETPTAPIVSQTPQARYFREERTGFYYGMYIEDSTLWYTVGTSNYDAQGRFSLDLRQREFTVAYDAGEGQGAPPPQSKTFGQPLTLSTVKPTRSGYQFMGWALAPGQAARFPSGGSFPYEQDQTLYAAWQQNRVEVDGLYYVINSDHAVLVGYQKGYNNPAPTIQSQVEGKPVTAIGYRAFYAESGAWNYWLRSLVIPDTVTSIGEQACFGCLNLTQLTLPDSVLSIGQSAFESCQAIENLRLPANLQETGMMAFYNASTNLVIQIPASLTKMGDYTFGRQKTVQEFRVHPDNPSYTSQDGVLFNKDMTTLIAYPMSNPRSAYQAPSTVKMVYCLSFANPHHYGTVPLKMLYLPQPNPLQAMGYTFDQMGRGKPFIIYGMQGTKLWRQVMDNLIAFTWIEFRDTAFGTPPIFVDSVAIAGGNTIPATADLQLSAAVTPTDAFDLSVIWASSDPDVAVVSQNGVVTGVAPGEVIITASARDRGVVATAAPVSDSHTVTVTAAATAAELDACAVQFVRDMLSFLDYTYPMADGNTATQLQALVETKINGLDLRGVAVSVSIGDGFTPAQAGYLAAPAGLNGSYDLSFALSRNAAAQTLSLPGRVITATAYVAQPQVSISASALEVERGQKIILTAHTVDIFEPVFSWYQDNYPPFGYELANTGSVNTLTVDTAKMGGTRKFGVSVNGKQSEFISVQIKEPFVPVTGFAYLPRTAVSGVVLDLSGQVFPSNATAPDIYWEISENNTLPGVELTDTLLLAEETGLLLMKATVINGAVDEEGNRCDFSQEFELDVVERYVPVNGIPAVPARIPAREWITLPPLASPDNATQRTVIWSLPEEGAKYGTLVENGKLWSEYESVSDNPVQQAVVVATIKDGGGPGVDYTQAYYISVDAPYNKIESVSGLPAVMIAGTPLPLTAQLTPSDALEPYLDAPQPVTKSLAWAISPRNLLNGLTIDGGKLYASRGGQARLQLIVRNGLGIDTDFVEEFTVSVFMPVSGLSGLLSRTTAGQPTALTATVQPFDANMRQVVWSLAPDNTLAGLTLEENMLTAASSGSARLLATVPGGLGSGRDYTQTVTVTVLPDLTVSRQPIDVTVRKGSEARFTVVAAGSPTPTYQWQELSHGQWRQMEGENSGEFVLTAVTAEQNGNRYRCVIANSTGSLTSDVATLTVQEAPYFISSPRSVDVLPGSNVTFQATAGGNPAPSYQWQILRQGEWQDIEGATAASYPLADVQAAQDGARFRCRLTNVLGSVTSSPVTLSVGEAPLFHSQPTSLTVIQGEPAVFTVQADAYPAAVYQWQKCLDGVWYNISGAEQATYTISYTTAEHNGLRLRCLASNRYGSVTSAEVALTMILKPIILQQPQCGAFAVNSYPLPVSLTALESGNMTYTWQCWNAETEQWTIDLGNVFSGQDYGYPWLLYLYSATLADAGRQYRCQVQNEAGTVFSDTITLEPVAQFVAVSQIHNVPTSLHSGQSLSGSVLPATASNQAIQWSVSSANTLEGVAIHDNVLTSPLSGRATVTATVFNGLQTSISYGPYQQDFTIEVSGEDQQTIAYCLVDGIAPPPPSQLAGGETVAVTLQLANGEETTQPMQFLLAVYQEGRLLAVYTPPPVSAAPGFSGQVENYTFALPPNCAGCTLVCYAWDSLSSPHPLTEPVRIW